MNIVERAKNICLTPTTEWPIIGAEPAATGPLITGYAAFPLRVVTLIGFVGALLALALTVAFFVYRIAQGDGPSGLVSAFGMLFFLVGVQLVIMGVLGEYIGRIYIEAKGRPYFLIDSVESNDAARRASR